MRKSILVSLLALGVPAILYGQTYRALFLGNSYTAANSLPQMIGSLAASMGDSLIWEWNTPGGYTLEGHSTNAQSIALIKQEKWDFVVLQEQSQRPAFPPSQVANEVYPYASALDSIIRDNWACSEPMFFMTWGRKYGDQQNCPFYPPLCTFEGMQGRLRQSYLEMAQDNNASVAPAGMAWKLAWQTDSTIDLWSGDFSHPSLEGSYLTACVFYATMFRKPPSSAWYSGIPVTTAQFLQQIAATVVFDSLNQWIGSGDLPYAEFSHVDTGLTVHFYDHSINAISWAWDFGDASQSSLQEPVHVYSSYSPYLLRLSINSQCHSHFTSDSLILISPSGLEYENRHSGLAVWPQPAAKQVTIKGLDHDSELLIIDLNGRIVRTMLLDAGIESTEIDVSGLESGYYFVAVTGPGQQRSIPLIISR